jgi:hypothetical protein
VDSATLREEVGNGVDVKVDTRVEVKAGKGGTDGTDETIVGIVKAASAPLGFSGTGAVKAA